MKIGYADIVNQYHKNPHAMYLCFLVKKVFRGLDPDKVLKKIAVDTYGPFVGRIHYWFSIWFLEVTTLENMYPNIGDKLKIREFSTGEVGRLDSDPNQFTFEQRRALRIAVLTKLAQKYPNTQFDVE